MSTSTWCQVQVRFKLPSGGSEAGCAALRVDQMWDHGLVLCHWARVPGPRAV